MCSELLLQKGAAGQDTVSSLSVPTPELAGQGNWQNQPAEPGFGWPQVDLGHPKS